MEDYILGYLQSRKIARDFMVDRSDILKEVAFERMKTLPLLIEIGADKFQQEKAIIDILFSAKKYIVRALNQCKEDLAAIEKYETKKDTTNDENQ